ncbi:MAG: SgcJ/EcaC family oxidoreductase [Myxococcota bacterium]
MPLLLLLARPILITVDDLPIAASDQHPEAKDRAAITGRMLAAFAKHRVPALGLVTTSKIRGPEDEALLRRWEDAGLELGNHSDRHLSYTATSSAAYIADVERARVRLSSLLQKPVRFFRYPFLREGDTPAKLAAMQAYLAATGQRAMPVTIDDQDWSLEEPYLKAKRARKAGAELEVVESYLSMLTRAIEHHEEVGDELLGRETPQILLLHATDVGSASWDRLFSWLEAHGHRFASADEVMADPAFGKPMSYVGSKGFGVWDRLRAEKRRADAKAAIEALLHAQAAAWTSGDLVAFCSVYAEDATFISPTGKTQGRRAILERYQKKYGSAKETMGALSLDVEEIRLADGYEVTAEGDALPSKVHGASVIMRWRLQFPKKPPAEGLSMIALFVGSDGQWRIAQDASM